MKQAFKRTLNLEINEKKKHYKENYFSPQYARVSASSYDKQFCRHRWSSNGDHLKGKAYPKEMLSTPGLHCRGATEVIPMFLRNVPRKVVH